MRFGHEQFLIEDRKHADKAEWLVINSYRPEFFFLEARCVELLNATLITRACAGS
jgi:hypothetical protein